jgi:hypothetical protein
VWQLLFDVSEVLAASIAMAALMLEAASSSETSVNFHWTTRLLNTGAGALNVSLRSFQVGSYIIQLHQLQIHS